MYWNSRQICSLNLFNILTKGRFNVIVLIDMNHQLQQWCRYFKECVLRCTLVFRSCCVVYWEVIKSVSFVSLCSMCRSTSKRVFPSLYIEDLTELRFNDITRDDPDFTSIQGQFTCGHRLDHINRNAILCSFYLRIKLLYRLPLALPSLLSVCVLH